MSEHGVLATRNHALDGLRGLAVAAVVVYHVWPASLPGGYLGVSIFFTLSGFLITSLLLDEWRRRGRVDARRFWTRRARRLIPAALAALALAVTVTAVAGTAEQLHTLGGDVTAASTYVANWRFIALGQAYGASYLEPSSLLHTWSLAIEEQFYLGLGLVAFVVARRARTLRPWCIVVAAIALVSVIANLWFSRQGAAAHDRIYFGTDTRAFELAAGMALAVALHARRIPRRRWFTVTFTGIGTISLAGLTAAMFTFDDRAPILRQGGLLGFALLSTAVVAAVTVPGPLTRALSFKPFVGLGVISYGVYLYHWPLLTLLSPQRVHLDGVPLGVVQVGVSIALAVLSYRFLESPIRHGHWHVPMRRLLPATIAVSAVVVIAAMWSVDLAAKRAVAGDVDIALPTSSASSGDTDADTAGADAIGADAIGADAIGADAAGQPPLTSAAIPPLRSVLFLGDSLVHQGFPTMVDELARAGIQASAIGGPAESFLTDDGAWVAELEAAVDELDPDAVVLEACCGSGLHQGADSDDPMPWADNPKMRVWEQRSIAATDVVTSRGKLALWVITPPSTNGNWYGRVEERMEVIRRFNLRLAQCREFVDIVDWRVLANPDGSYAAALPDRSGNMIEVRAGDMLHFTLPGQRLIAQITRDDLAEAWTRMHREGDAVPAGSDCAGIPPAAEEAR